MKSWWKFSKQGKTRARLTELKFSCGKSYYMSGTRLRVFERAEYKRAGELLGVLPKGIEGGQTARRRQSGEGKAEAKASSRVQELA